MDLAGTQAALNKSTQAIATLRPALQLNNARLAKNPASSNLALSITSDPRFAPLQAVPEFQKLLPPKK